MNLKFLTILFSFLLAFPSYSQNKFILSIGISNFKDKKFSNLSFSRKDAKDFAIGLKKSWKKIKYGRVLHSSKGVSKKKILSNLKKLKLKNKSEKDVVVIYFSTHGAIERSTSTGKLEKYLITSDSDSNKIEKTALSFNEIRSIFKSLKSKRKALIIDSCFSGKGKSFLSKEVSGQLQSLKSGSELYQYLEAREGELYLYSSQGNETSIEDVGLQNSIYTHYLIKGFNQDLNKDQIITLTEAHHYAQKNTIEKSNRNQNPTLSVYFDGNDPIILSGKNLRNSSYLFSSSTRFQFLEVIIDEKNFGDLTQEIKIKSGKRRISLRDPTRGKILVDTIYFFKKGKSYEVSTILNLLEQNYTLQILVSSFSLIGDEKTRFLPDSSLGFGAYFRKHKFWKTFDLGLGFEYYQVKEENPEVFNESFIVQDRAMTFLNLEIGQLYLLPLFSSSRGTFLTQLRWSLGPTFYLTELDKSFRNINSKENEIRKATSNNFRYGPNLSAQLIFSSLPANLEGSIGFKLMYLKSPFDTGNSFIFAQSTHLNVGIIW